MIFLRYTKRFTSCDFSSNRVLLYLPYLEIFENVLNHYRVQSTLINIHSTCFTSYFKNTHFSTSRLKSNCFNRSKSHLERFLTIENDSKRLVTLLGPYAVSYLCRCTYGRRQSASRNQLLRIKTDISYLKYFNGDALYCWNSVRTKPVKKTNIKYSSSLGLTVEAKTQTRT